MKIVKALTCKEARDILGKPCQDATPEQRIRVNIHLSNCAGCHFFLEHGAADGKLTPEEDLAVDRCVAECDRWLEECN